MGYLTWIRMGGNNDTFFICHGDPFLIYRIQNHWRAHLFDDGNVMHRATSPLIDENLSPSGLQVRHDPFNMTRVDKLNFITDFCLNRQLPIPKLAVCWQQRKPGQTTPNCNQCEKCYRTMCSIVAIGKDPREFGFSLSPKKLIPQFKAFIKDFKTKTRMTYTFYRDIQEYTVNNIRRLPSEYRPFYRWFISLDLWKMVEEDPRPLRSTPFSWEDYRDLYPAMPANKRCRVIF